MNRFVRMTMLSSALVVPSPLLADDCSEDTAADFNSRIEANFSIMESSDTQDVTLGEKIEALQKEFSQAGKIHSEALENHDQAALDEACGMYESILKAQAGLGE